MYIDVLRRLYSICCSNCALMMGRDIPDMRHEIERNTKQGDTEQSFMSI